MIVKSIKDSEFEIVIQQSELGGLYSVTLLKNDRQAEFQGNLDFETSLQIFDYYLDRMTNNDLTGWQGAIE